MTFFNTRIETTRRLVMEFTKTDVKWLLTELDHAELDSGSYPVMDDFQKELKKLYDTL